MALTIARDTSKDAKVQLYEIINTKIASTSSNPIQLSDDTVESVTLEAIPLPHQPNEANTILRITFKKEVVGEQYKNSTVRYHRWDLSKLKDLPDADAFFDVTTMVKNRPSGTSMSDFFGTAIANRLDQIGLSGAEFEPYNTLTVTHDETGKRVQALTASADNFSAFGTCTFSFTEGLAE